MKLIKIVKPKPSDAKPAPDVRTPSGKKLPW